MSSLYEQYAELIALAQLYGHQERAEQEWINTNPSNYAFFKDIAQKSAKKPIQIPPPPIPQAINSPAPSVIQPLQPSLPKKQLSTPILEVKPPEPVIPSPSKTEAQPVSKEHSHEKMPKLDPMVAPSTTDLNDMRKIVAEQFPHQSILEEPPSDQEAKIIGNAWRQAAKIPAIAILTFDEPPQHKVFLDNLAKALTLCHRPATLISAHKIEKDKSWDQLLESSELELVIAVDLSLRSKPELMKHYREISKGKSTLGNKPLCLLSDIALYLKEPKFKAVLWKVLCDMLSR
jgi:hypothetical protein